MNVSVVIPVLNEETGIKSVLDSLFLQSYMPSEIVIADGGSTDNTIAVINDYKNKGVLITIVDNEEKLPGAGRNVATRSAKYDLIACIDAGNTAETDWLEQLIAPIKNDDSIDVVYGKYVPAPMTPFERSVVAVNYSFLREYFADTETCGEVFEKQKEHPPFTGSSLLYKKTAWERAGGFPVWLRAGEDKLFGENLLNAGCKLTYTAKAVIRHHIRGSARQMFRQGYIYERANGYSRQTSNGVYHIIYKYIAGAILLLAAIFFPLLLVLLGLAVLAYTYRFGYALYLKFYNKFPGAQELLAIPLALFARDLGLMLGIVVGLRGYSKNPLYKKRLDEYLIAKGG